MTYTHKRAHFFVQFILAFCLVGTLSAQTIGYWKFDEKAPGNSTDTTSKALSAGGRARNKVLRWDHGSNHFAEAVKLSNPTGGNSFSG